MATDSDKSPISIAPCETQGIHAILIRTLKVFNYRNEQMICRGLGIQRLCCEAVQKVLLSTMMPYLFRFYCHYQRDLQGF